MFDIAMNTKGALNFNDLSSLSGGSAPQNNTQMTMGGQQGMPMGGQQGMPMGNQPNMGNMGMNQPNNTMGMQPAGSMNQPNNMGMGVGQSGMNQGMQAQNQPNMHGNAGMQNNQPNMGMNQPTMNNNGMGINQPNMNAFSTQNNAQQPMNNTQQPMNNAPVHHYEAQAKGGVILKKGGKTSLSKMIGAGNVLKNIDVCLGWDVGSYGTYDLDSSCFILGDNGKVIGDDWFVFYNQPVSPDGAIRHNGDNKTGAGDGDDEIISIDLSRLSPQVKKLAFVITINDAVVNGYSFKNIANAYARVVDKMTGKELAFFNLSDYYDGITAMTVCEIYNHNGDWKINPVGNGLSKTGLEELCAFYGVNVAG